MGRWPYPGLVSPHETKKKDQRGNETRANRTKEASCGRRKMLRANTRPQSGAQMSSTAQFAEPEESSPNAQRRPQREGSATSGGRDFHRRCSCSRAFRRRECLAGLAQLSLGAFATRAATRPARSARPTAAGAGQRNAERARRRQGQGGDQRWGRRCFIRRRFGGEKVRFELAFFHGNLR